MDEKDEQIRDLQKQIKTYIRRYENAVKATKIVERVKDNYEVFYQSSLKEQEALNKQLEQLAWFDSLTGLPNRKNFDNFLHKSISQTDRNKLRSALLFIDLDGFKDINDTFGHYTGDRLLSVISDRLKDVIRNEDLLARLGGDEFVIVATAIKESSHAAFVAKRVIDACQDNIIIDNKVLNISASVGIALYPDNIEQSSELSYDLQLQQFADLAMYRAKQQGKNCYCYYDKKMSEQANKDLKLRKKTREAIGDCTFVPAIQPIYRSSSNTIAGFEALARWPQANGECISPLYFMPTLQKVNLISELDFIIFEKVLRFIQCSPEFMNTIEFASVNFDGSTFCQKNFFKRFIDLLGKYGVDSKHIVLELTESTLIEHDSRATKNIEALAKENIRLALDDFGTGYSGLSYLKRFPINIIKIDKYFTQSLPEDQFSMTIVRHLLNMAEDLGFEVIAEGVEKMDQLNYYEQERCDLLQGYLIAKPTMHADTQTDTCDSDHAIKPNNDSQWRDALKNLAKL